MSELKENSAELTQIFQEALKFVQQGEYEKSVSLYQQAYEICEKEQNTIGQAQSLYNIALNKSSMGDMKAAGEAWERCINVLDSAEDNYARASIYHNIATAMAHSDINKAEILWQKSLQLKEQINDSYGKASTLANLAWVAHNKEDKAGEITLYKESARILGLNHAWNDLVTVLLNLSRADAEKAIIYQAQVFYLFTYLELDADTIFFLVSDLLKNTGLESETAPVFAAVGVILINLATEKEEIRNAAMEILAACALVRNISREEISDWIIKNQLNEPEFLIPKLEESVMNIVAESQWLFDVEVLRYSTGEGHN